jgi:hypothetical protein
VLVARDATELAVVTNVVAGADSALRLLLQYKLMITAC